MLLTAGRVVTPARLFAPGWVHIEGEQISEVGPGEPPREADLDLPTATVVPGFVDAHAHGGGGASFDTGAGIDTAEAAATVAAAHLRHGTTTMMASLVTDTPDSTLRSVRELSALVAERAARRRTPRGALAQPQPVRCPRPGSC